MKRLLLFLLIGCCFWLTGTKAFAGIPIANPEGVGSAASWAAVLQAAHPGATLQSVIRQTDPINGDEILLNGNPVYIVRFKNAQGQSVEQAFTVFAPVLGSPNLEAAPVGDPLGVTNRTGRVIVDNTPELPPPMLMSLATLLSGGYFGLHRSRRKPSPSAT